MITHDRPTIMLEHARSSGELMRLSASISDAAIAVFDVESHKLPVTTFETGNDTNLLSYGSVDCTSSKVRSVDAAQLSDADTALLDKSAPIAVGVEKSWYAFNIALQAGAVDKIVLFLGNDENFDLIRYYLKSIWPILRQDCLQECSLSTIDPMPLDRFSEGWDLLNRIDVAMLVLNSNCQMVRVNVAARELLDSGTFLKRGNGGIFAALREDTCAFHKAVTEAAQLRGQEDIVVFLTSKTGDKRVPVTLSRYFYRGTPTSYVVAMLPTPPSSRRVERLVKQMGLTSSEARVAALMQLGLSNREAAEVSGLKPQTLNTYAKRILNKLNVSGRTEMAQLLTWQASGGRSA